MKKINFKKLQVPTNIKQNIFVELDCAEQISEAIYQNASTQIMRSISERISENGECEFTDSEINEIKKFLDSGIIKLPVQDAILNKINECNNNEITINNNNDE